MNETNKGTLLVVGATGSIGRQVVAEGVREGWEVRALVRDEVRAGRLDSAATRVVGDLTRPETLSDALDGVDAVVFTQGAAYGDPTAAEFVDYGAVKNVLQVLAGRPVRIALMTAIGVTVRSNGHDWKRRGERLVRASGNDYTIVRPGWFDYNDADQLAITLLQGDSRRAGSPADGVIARRQIARVLVGSLSSPSARNVTVELVAEKGEEQRDLDAVFATVEPDPSGSLDGVKDLPNMQPEAEPASVRNDLERVQL